MDHCRNWLIGSRCFDEQNFNKVWQTIFLDKKVLFYYFILIEK